MTVQPFLIGEGWVPVIDGNPTAAAIYSRHYSRRPGPRRFPNMIVGPGGKMVLLWPDARALFVWRRSEHRMDDQRGVECAVFRNEGAGLSSTLILAAERHAWARWPGERLFTFVNAGKTAARRSSAAAPGACFVHAGWRPCGISRRGLDVLEKLPAWLNE